MGLSDTSWLINEHIWVQTDAKNVGLDVKTIQELVLSTGEHHTDQDFIQSHWPFPDNPQPHVGGNWMELYFLKMPFLATSNQLNCAQVCVVGMRRVARG